MDVYFENCYKQEFSLTQRDARDVRSKIKIRGVVVSSDSNLTSYQRQQRPVGLGSDLLNSVNGFLPKQHAH